MIPRWAEGRHILLGVTGGVAAYKIPELVRLYTSAGCEVEVIMTEAGATMVSPLVLSTLTHRPVWRDADFFSPERGWMIPHIKLAEWADVFVIAPATADILRAADAGDSSSLLGAAMLVYGGREFGRRPMLFFPSMNENMWNNEKTQANIARLQSVPGITLYEPEMGALACRSEGRGRMPSPGTIACETWRAICPKRGEGGRPDLEGKRFLITAGPTREYIDPVRFISNPSTGRMGCALAHEAYWRGADVTLVAGPMEAEPPAGVDVIEVTTAAEMLDACLHRMTDADVIIKAAAVGDYRPAEYSERKIKRGTRPEMTLELVRTPDIAASISARKTSEQLLVAFAAETEELLENARLKIESKGLDMIVANNVTQPGAGFASETNSVTLVDGWHFGGGTEKLEGRKIDVASGIIDHIVRIMGRLRPEEAASDGPDA